MPDVECFFDCSSPWTYFAFHRLLRMQRELGIEIAWRPILVGGVFNAVNPSVHNSREKPVPAKVAYGEKDQEDWARHLGIRLTTFAEHGRIDLTIDGADEVERGTLNLIKGLGGALLREKIVAAASDRLVIVVDHDKLVPRLGTHTPVPVEVAQFGWQATAAALSRLGSTPKLRLATEDHQFITDGGNYILDCAFGPIADPQRLERRIEMIVGVFESGLFVGRSTAVVMASTSGVAVMTPAERKLP